MTRFDDTGQPEVPAASEIICPQCGRTLRVLSGPRCNWCGAAIRAEEYAVIAAQSHQVMAVPAPLPLPPVTSYAQQSSLGGGWGGPRPWYDFLPRQVQSFRPNTPWQARLRVVVVALFGVLAAVEIAYHLYAIWALHRVMQTLPMH